MNRQKLFETIINVTGFTPLEGDMDEIQNAVLYDLNLQNISKDLIVEYTLFCVRCDRQKLPLLSIEDYINQYSNK